MKKYIMIIILLLMSHAIHASNGGVMFDYKKYPYLSIIVNNVDDKYLQPCLSSVIGKNVAFTAAHCVDSIHDFHSKNLYVYENSKMETYEIKKWPYDKRNSLLAPWYDTGLVFTDPFKSIEKLTVDMAFDPFAYISKQPRQEILFPLFGLDSESLHKEHKLKIMTGTLSVMSGNRCSDQLEDLLHNEGYKLDDKVKFYLEEVKLVLKKEPSLLFCVFNRKSDKIQITRGDSGGPLIINYNNRDMLAGVLSVKVDISKSNNYSSIAFFTNSYISYDFLRKCNFQNRVKSILSKNNEDECKVSGQNYLPSLYFLLDDG